MSKKYHDLKILEHIHKFKSVYSKYWTYLRVLNWCDVKHIVWNDFWYNFQITDSFLFLISSNIGILPAVSPHLLCHTMKFVLDSFTRVKFNINLHHLKCVQMYLSSDFVGKKPKEVFQDKVMKTVGKKH